MRNLLWVFMFISCQLMADNLIVKKADLVKVDKSERLMHLLAQGKSIRAYRISLGASPEGHKQQEGDEKTPEGRYTLDYIKENSSYYRAMHVSYPNALDKQRANERGVSAGGFIMVHGQPNGWGWLSGITQLFDWTDGCIAISNADMDEFIDLVPVGTPIEIIW